MSALTAMRIVILRAIDSVAVITAVSVMSVGLETAA